MASCSSNGDMDVLVDWHVKVGGGLKSSELNGGRGRGVISDADEAGNSRARRGGVRRMWRRTFWPSSGDEGTVTTMAAGGGDRSDRGSNRRLSPRLSMARADRALLFPDIGQGATQAGRC